MADEVERRLPERTAGAAASGLERFPARYAECFAPAEIALHVRLLAEVSPHDPVRFLVRPRENGEVECTTLSFDHPALFSLICGALSSLGLNVLSGDAFTSLPGSAAGSSPPRLRHRVDRREAGRTRPAVAARRQVVDLLRGTVRSELDLARWQEAAAELLSSLVRILEEEGGEEGRLRARERVNEMVAEALASFDVDVTQGLYPVDLSMDRERDGCTLLEVVSEDTPFFLYAFSSALALRGFSIESVRIRTEGSRIRDEFGIVDRLGGPVRDPSALDHLRLSALLTKQFSYFLSSSPDPTAAMARFDELTERALSPADGEAWVRTLSDPRALQDLARLLGASDFLWEDFIRRQYEALLPILARRERPEAAFEASSLRERLEAALASARSYAEKVEALNAWKDGEIFACDLEHILDPEAGHAELGRRLTRLAECVVAGAAELSMAQLEARHGIPRTVAGLAVPFAIMGLGKLGGEALGYASDIELLVVYQDSGSTDGPERIENGELYGRLARELALIVRSRREGIFTVDLRLRPYGSSGQAACSLESFCRYYGRGGDAHSSERLALVSMRAVAGDRAFGERLERLRDELLYVSGSIDMQELRSVRARQAREKDAIRRPNAKFSPGALVDLEYTVQILQVRHGAESPALRTPRIREALAALKDVALLDPWEAERLGAAYGFLRGLINALRMLRGSARDLELPDPASAEYTHLARRMGYPSGTDPARRLHLDFEAHTAEVRSFMQRHFEAAILSVADVGSFADLVLSEEVGEELKGRILRAAGIRDPSRGYRNLKGLAGSGRTRELFARLAVLAGEMLPRKPDADMALNNWERAMGGREGVEAEYERLLRQPTRLDILLAVFGSSQYLSDTLMAYPAFFDWLADLVATGKVRGRPEMERDLAELCSGSPPESRGGALRLFKRRELARIGVRDVSLGAPLEEVCLEISELADTLIGGALAWALGDLPEAERRGMAILAFGKLGGRELNYSSDIDLLGVHAEPGGESTLAAALERLQRELGGHTDAGYVYRVDYRLRPYGSSGELATSLAALRRYYERSASPWELGAALKVRFVAGDARVGEEAVRVIRLSVVARVAEALSSPESRARLREGLRRLRETSSRPRGRLERRSFDLKNGRGGIRDVESLVQGLQLEGCVDHPELLEGNTLRALELARQVGLLPAGSASTLREAYVFLRKVEHYLQLYDDRQTHALPTEEWRLQHLARCLLGPDATAGSFLARLEVERERVMGELERMRAGS